MDLARRRFLQLVPGGYVALASSTSVLAQHQTASNAEMDLPQRLETESDWRQVRLCFPMAHDLTYLNAGGLGPAPSVVLQSVCDTVCSLQGHTNHGHALIEEARPIVAKFLGADPNEVAFTRNATEGNSTIAAGLPLNKGDEVVLDAHAHPGGAIAWLTRQKYEGIKVKIFEPDSQNAVANVERIVELLGPRTRVIQVSHVTAPTGIRLPVTDIATIAAERNIWFHIDGAQSWGMFPLNVAALGCDSYATCGHKWICGPTGTGVLYVRHDRLNEVQPTDVGAYATTDWPFASELELVDSARRFECGTRDASTIVGLTAAVKFMDSIGIERIARRGAQLTRYLRQRLKELEQVELISPQRDELSTAMTTFRRKGQSCDQLFRHLMGQRLRCRPVRERGLDAIRVSTHLFNAMAEVDQVVSALATL